MKIQAIMNQAVKSCNPETNLAAAAMIMWDNDCGFIPIVSSDQKVLGVITDRDICMAVATKHRRAEEITVGEVGLSQEHPIFSCQPDDDVRMALETMSRQRIRRLPVVNKEGVLIGVLSMNDIVLNAHELFLPKGKKTATSSYEDIISTYRSLCEHRLPHQLAA